MSSEYASLLFREGKDAFDLGRSFLRDNPHRPYTLQWHTWRSGYIEAAYYRFSPESMMKG